MKGIKELFCIGTFLLLLCSSLIGCSAPQEEIREQVTTDDSTMAAIIEKWETYVVDRTVKITQVQLTYGMADSHMGLQMEETVICEILDICETLDVSTLKLTEENAPPEISVYGELYVVLSAVGDEIDSILLHFKDDGEVFLRFDIEGTCYWAHTSGWFVSDLLQEYKYK